MDEGTVTCRNCDHDIDDSLTWCPFCGTEVDPDAAEVRREEASAAIAASADGDDEQVCGSGGRRRWCW